MAAIAYADLQPGMVITATTDWTTTGASAQVAGTIVSVTDRCIIFDTGDSAPNPAWIGSDQTVSFDQTGGAAIIAEPAAGTILLDETSAAWQRLTGGWYSINGDLTDWAGFLAAHPTYTTMKDSPVTPLPAPVAPYPTTITPDAVKIGMDIRVTVTYAAGGSRVIRGICAWTQSNPPTDDATPDYIWLVLAVGSVFQFNPLADGQTLTIEQMQDWTANPDWGSVNQPEPAIGTIARSSQGIAWQRIANATADGPIVDGVGPWYTTGQGLWQPVTQSFIFTTTAGLGGLPTTSFDGPINWIYLWAAAAPFNLQIPA